jgi:ABC-type transporter Mla subunit MlaD
MRTRALSLGLLILVAVVALAGAMIRLRGARGPVLYAWLRTGSGLREGAAVSFRGIPVGEVTDITVVRNTVRLTIALNRADVPLRQGDGVRVRRNGILGEAELEIVPTATPGVALGAGAVLLEVSPDPASVRREAVERAWLRAIGQATGLTITRDSGTGRTSVP